MNQDKLKMGTISTSNLGNDFSIDERKEIESRKKHFNVLMDLKEKGLTQKNVVKK